MKISDKIKKLLSSANDRVFTSDNDPIYHSDIFTTLSIYIQNDEFQVGFEKWDQLDFDDGLETPGARYKGMLFDYVSGPSLAIALNNLEVELFLFEPKEVPTTIERNGYTYTLVGKSK